MFSALFERESLGVGHEQAIPSTLYVEPVFISEVVALLNQYAITQQTGRNRFLFHIVNPRAFQWLYCLAIASLSLWPSCMV